MEIKTIDDVLKFFDIIKKVIYKCTDRDLLKEHGITAEDLSQVTDVDIISMGRSGFMDYVSRVYINNDIESVKEYDNMYKILQQYDKEHPQEFTQYMQQYPILTDFYSIIPNVKNYVSKSNK